MPGWHQALKKIGPREDLVVLGVIQEQHAERCRLFAQWHQFDWPILHDPLNLIATRAVPRTLAIDEHGVVRDLRPRAETLVDKFLSRKFTAPVEVAAPLDKQEPQDWNRLLAEARRTPTAENWQAVGQAAMLWGESQQLELAIQAYLRAIELVADDAPSHFRLGVAYRMRFDSPAAQPGDFRRAVQYWTQALELDPNHYIFRRRIQQYGPRLSKPYPFYDWVETARREIRQRGERPIALVVEPSGAELAQPSRKFTAQRNDPESSPDPAGRIRRDLRKLIRLEQVVVPGTADSNVLRVHLVFTPRATSHWNNEAEPLRVWLESSDDYELSEHSFTIDPPAAAESTESRRVEVEIRLVKQPRRATILRGFALYNVCEQQDGQCLFLRQDVSLRLDASGAQ